ncbi:MAG: NAD-dependent epimerase/dehydratase family protein [Phaeodactylibacter sp.]|nr:NAD-dependent epimerase/dehydratase family protein [Phaeodactylibacter sp.]MCB9277013.1 NAD-dependent epimerase/dehydratase family protein [Lewinellaceae bacterium]
MKIFITGADGMLGSHIVREVLERGHEAKAFLLPGSPSKALDGLDVGRFYGNILNPEEVNDAMEGCDAVIHAAADTNVWPSRSEKTRAINIDGTKNLVSAARAWKAKRFVHVGSGSSFGIGPKDKPGDESSPFTGHRYGLDYVDSKYDGQQFVLQAYRETGFPAIVVAPTFMFGPHDSKPGSGAMIIAAYQGKLPAVAPGGKNFVHVKDVAVAATNALTMGRLGECYIAGHQNLSYSEITAIIADELKSVAPRLQAPAALLKAVGLAGSFMGNVLGITPKLSYPMAVVACDGQYYSPRKAVAELGMPQTDIRVAIREAFDWFRSNGYC